MHFIPTNIEKHSDTEMKISWNNHSPTIVPFQKLRLECRCAECVDEWTRVRRIKPETIALNICPVSVELVGRYAIQIIWSDGHKTGIYPFDLLYQIAVSELSATVL